MSNKKIKILLDPQIFIQKYGGISRLFVEIYAHLKNDASFEIHLPLLYSENEYLRSKDLLPYNLSKILSLPFVSKYLINKSLKSKLFRFNKKLANFYLKFKHYDIILVTYFDDYFMLNKKHKTLKLVTVYDLIHEKFTSKERDVSMILSRKKNIYFTSDYLVCISSSTKNDLLLYYSQLSSKPISVVHLAANYKFNKNLPNPQPASICSKYLLFVGMRQSYKNFNWMIEKLSNWLIFNNFQLFCIGGLSAFDETERSLISKLGLSDIIKHYNVEDDKMPEFYFNAFAFIYPSKYEGFGIPILESMSVGCPVLINNNSSLIEVAGDAGLYFNYQDNSLLDQLDNLKDTSFYSNVKQKCLLQAQAFSWEQTCKNYKSIISALIYK